MLASNDTVSSTADVVFKAGDEIRLQDGFTAQTGSEFRAVVNPALSNLVDHWQVTLFSYDNNGRVQDKYIFTKGLTDSTQLTYAYDRQGNITQVDIQQGSDEVHHWNSYDDRSLLDSVYVSQSTTKPSASDLTFDYTPTGLLKSAVFSKTLSYQYHDRDWLTDINDVSSQAEPFAAKYVYFDDGNVQTATFFNSTSSIPSEKKYKYDFTYDKRKQLLSADYSFESGFWQSSTHFDVSSLQYDDNGNILSLTRNDSLGSVIDNLSYRYSSNNQLDSLVENAASNTVGWDAEDSDYTYDANGNVISQTENGSPKFRTIHYESRNLPVFLELGDFTDIIYLYNSDGQRTFKKVDNNTGEHYIMDGSLNVGVFDESGLLQHWNIIADGVVGRLETGGKLYYIKDHLGSTRAVVNESGGVVESHDYYPS